MKVSIISPVYKAENIINELVSRIVKEVKKITNKYEIILVEDGSPDNSWKKIKENCIKNKNVKGIKLSRNFGQHYAVTAGTKNATGDFIIFMDCDLQDNPKYIKILLDEFNKGYEVVFTKRLNRKHSVMKSIYSKIYTLLFDYVSDKNYNINVGSLVGFSKKVQNSYNKFKDKDRLYLQILKWLGYKSTIIEVKHDPRYEGISSYNFMNLLSLGIQGWTSYSNKLLKISIYFGFILAISSISLGIWIIIRYLTENLMPGWPSIIVTILFSTGIILISIGILGIYIGKIFEQSKDRPLYIIQKQINFK